MTDTFSEDDRNAAIEGLRARLTAAELRAVLPLGLEKTVARVENRNKLYTPRLKDPELAPLVVDLHGPELLRDRNVRALLAKRASDQELQQLLSYDNDAPPPRGRSKAEAEVVSRNWHAGKSWPRYFAHVLQLPPALAGSPDGGQAPDFEDVDPYVPLPKLHDFQEDLQREVLKYLHAPAGANRAMLSLPTGAGKTRTVVEAVVGALREGTLPGRFVLWIAQSDELCEQALEAFREVWTDQCVQAALKDRERRQPPLRLFRLWSTRSAPDPAERGVIVAGINKLDGMCRAGSDAPRAVLDAVGPVIVDEAHHAIAPSYTHVFDALGLGRRKSESGRAMIGLTATPYRGSADESRQLVGRFYGNLLKPRMDDSLTRLRAREILAEMIPKCVQTFRRYDLQPREKAHLTQFRDLPDSALNRIGSDPERNRLILEEMLEFPEGCPVLVFGCSVNHAQAMALLLRRKGRSAAVVTGGTPRSLRRAWIGAFRDGDLQFLCNYGVLTTGFDAPKVEAIVIARPTASVLLYEQMVGRGMRGPANGGTSRCVVVDLVDVIPQFGDQMSYQRYADLWSRRRPA